jgi:hypothetical protein
MKKETRIRDVFLKSRGRHLAGGEKVFPGWFMRLSRYPHRFNIFSVFYATLRNVLPMVELRRSAAGDAAAALSHFGRFHYGGSC